MKKIDWEDIRENIFGLIIMVIFIPVVILFFVLLSTADDISEVGLVNAIKGCTIKGNINDSGEKIYHLKGREYYKETKVDNGNNEQVFCNEEQAKNEGFRKSKAPLTQDYINESERAREAQNNTCPAGAPRGC